MPSSWESPGSPAYKHMLELLDKKQAVYRHEVRARSELMNPGNSGWQYAKRYKYLYGERAEVRLASMLAQTVTAINRHPVNDKMKVDGHYLNFYGSGYLISDSAMQVLEEAHKLLKTQYDEL